MKEIKVKYIEQENYLELWKAIKAEKGEPKYYGRDIGGADRTWVYISNPECYREIDGPVPDDVIFVVCDEKNHECLRDSNGHHNPDFLTLEETIMEEWYKVEITVSKDEALEMDIKNWIHTFLDEDWVMTLKEQGMPCIYDNWMLSYKEVSERSIREFSFAGIPMCIYETVYEHTFCHQTFKRYQAGKKKMKSGEYYAKYFGCVHPREEGCMESILSARERVEEKLAAVSQKDYIYQIPSPITSGIFRKTPVKQAAYEIVGEKRINKKDMEKFLDNELWKKYAPDKETVLAQYPDAIFF